MLDICPFTTVPGYAKGQAHTLQTLTSSTSHCHRQGCSLQREQETTGSIHQVALFCPMAQVS